MTSPTEVTPHLPDPAMPSADWADAFEITTDRPSTDMRTLASETVGAMPGWAKQLLRLRNVLVVPFGLKPDGAKDAAKPDAMVGIFPIIEEARDRIVLGLDDKHVDFRIVLVRDNMGYSQRVRLTTVVQRHNVFGRAYIALVRPFHRAIVPAVLRNLAT